MSFYYTRREPQAVACKNYGYEKVSSSELRSIIMRMQRPTHSSVSDSAGPAARQPRPPSSVCKRAPPDEHSPHYRGLATTARGRRTKADQKAFDRMVRRLQKPTLNHLLNRNRAGSAPGERSAHQHHSCARNRTHVWPPSPPPPVSDSGPNTTRTSLEERKSVLRLSRPTTASKSKTFCVFCDDPDLDPYHDLDFSDEREVSRDELKDIVSRVQTATVASEGVDCWRDRPTSRSVPRDKLPLISGLARSRRVDDIVNRLCPPTSADTSSGRTPSAATPASAGTSSGRTPSAATPASAGPSSGRTPVAVRAGTSNGRTPAATQTVPAV